MSRLVRLTTATAEAGTHLCDAALEVALRRPGPPDGPLAGKRVRVSFAGGRVRPRRIPKTQRQALSKGLRHALRYETEGVEVVPEALRALATTRLWQHTRIVGLRSVKAWEGGLGQMGFADYTLCQGGTHGPCHR